MSVLCGVVLAAGGWGMLSHRSPQPVFLCNNGSTLTVVAVTYGKNHSAVVGNLKQRTAALLPSRLFPRLTRGLSVRTNVPRETFVVWLHWTNAASFSPYLLLGYVA